MAKAPKMKKGKEIIEEPHGIKPPKKLKIQRKKRKLESVEGYKKSKSLARYARGGERRNVQGGQGGQGGGGNRPPQLTPAQRQARSERMREYWRNLRENDPERYAQRIRQLHEGRRNRQRTETVIPNNGQQAPIPTPEIETPEIETPEIETPETDDSGEQIPIDLEETPDENGFYINPETGEVFDNYYEWQESLSNPPSYDPFKPDEDEAPLWDDLVLSNFLLDVYSRPTLNGSRFILNWIDTLIEEYGKSMVSAMIEFAKQEGYEIDVKLLYEEDKSSAMASGFMQFWYSKGFFAGDESIQNRYDPMKKIRGKMDKEFQQSQYTFGTSLMKAIEDDINADEVMQNYG